jgi:hypothetical protein
MPYPKNKYRKGYTIFGMDELIWDHLNKGRWVYLRDKVIHPSIILNMTLMTVRGFMEAHLISEAINARDEWASGNYKRPYPKGVKDGTLLLRD